MKHCLNKRINNAKINEPSSFEEELSWGHIGTQEKLPPTTDARWRSLINDDDAWLTEPAPTRKKEPYIDPRDFTGKSPKFSWE